MRSRVKIALRRPNAEALTIPIASSRPRILVIGATGPKVSSRAMSMAARTPLMTVGWK